MTDYDAEGHELNMELARYFGLDPTRLTVDGLRVTFDAEGWVTVAWTGLADPPVFNPDKDHNLQPTEGGIAARMPSPEFAQLLYFMSRPDLELIQPKAKS